MAEISVAIAVALLKGGVGKTTSAVGLAMNLGMAADQLGPVLFVDADPQATASTSRAGLVERVNRSLSEDVAERGEPTDQDLASVATFASVYPFEHTQIRHPDAAHGHYADSQDVLDQLKDFTSGRYDSVVLTTPEWAPDPAPEPPVAPRVMVIDTSPAFPAILDGVLAFLATQPRSVIVIPSSMDDYDLAQARQFPELLERSGAGQVPYAILATKVDGRRREHRDRFLALRDSGYPIFDTVVPYGAPFQRGPLSEYRRPKSPFNRVYKAVAAEAIRLATQGAGGTPETTEQR